MRSPTHWFRLALAAALCVAAALPAHAGANTIRMSIESSRQGQLKGTGGKPWIEVLQFDESVLSPRDASTGMGSGKRQHAPIKITKEVGAASLQLQKALATGEVLKEVVFEFIRDNAGKQLAYRTIKLVNAQIVSIQRKVGSGRESRELEEISFAYEKVEQTNNAGGKTPIDSWKTK